jgi:hypothetical protein
MTSFKGLHNEIYNLLLLGPPSIAEAAGPVDSRTLFIDVLFLASFNIFELSCRHD